MCRYALITAARNEENYIEKTIQSVVAQTIIPVKWVIVSDGSTDRTDEIVLQYARNCDFMQLLHADNDAVRNFGSKAKAVQAGYAILTTTVDFDFIGNLDADVSFSPDYFQKILAKFAENPQLGLAGGVRYDYFDDGFHRMPCARNSVGGPYQLFRRKCFEDVGGYLPLEYGGIDAVAEISARRYGWQVESFPEYKIYHHRCTGTANRTHLQARFRAGIRDYLIGYHPFFELMRGASWLHHKPRIFGALAMLFGYFFAFLRGWERPVSDEHVTYLQQEQLARIRRAISGEIYVRDNSNTHQGKGRYKPQE